MSVLKDYAQFQGNAWATGYVTNVLAYQGVKAPHTGQPYSEALLMGINGGLSVGYFAFSYEGHDPHLHVLTRYPFDENPGALFERLGIPMETRQTAHPEKARANVINALANGHPAVVWVDVVSLDPLVEMRAEDERMIFPLVVYGYDISGDRVDYAHLARCPLYTTESTFAAARTVIAKTKGRMMTLGAPNPDKLPTAVRTGIQACIDIFTGKPPVGLPSMWGFAAFDKWATLLREPKHKKSWAKEFAPGPRLYAGLTSTYRFLELFHTGGGGARGVYADFLDEAASILDRAALREVAVQFRASAARWTALAEAHLPETVEPLKEARRLMQADYRAFVERGRDGLDTRRASRAALRELRARIETDFPLGELDAARLRAELADRVIALRDAERSAIEALREAVA